MTPSWARSRSRIILFHMITGPRVSIIFLTLSIVIASASAVAVAQQNDATPFPNGVAAGDVTGESAILWARSAQTGAIRFEWSDAEDFATVIGSIDVTVDQPMVPARVEIAGLEPATVYYYRAVTNNGESATGRFVTPHLSGRRGLRFGVSGDWRGDLAPYPSVANVPSRNLDLFIALGDTIYADVPSPDLPLSQAQSLDEFRIKHNEVYSERAGTNRLADLRSSTAILALIDDHEVTNDFAGAAPVESDPRFEGQNILINESALFTRGLTAFVEYNPIRPEIYETTGDPRSDGKLKLYRRRDYGTDAVFILLDARSFRDEALPSVGPSASPAAIDAFLSDSFDESRTMLGEIQLNDLLLDLLDAYDRGVVWKFVLVPEPMQNLGPYLASDRFEGYAAERSRILAFIDDHDIRNVVFIAADIHGTVVNNLTYQESSDAPQIPLDAFEVTTGAVAYDAPFGPTVLSFAAGSPFGPLAALLQGVYSISGRALQDSLIALVGAVLFDPFGLDPIGLDNSLINATLKQGGYVATNHYGWTEFEIDADNAELIVTTWGINWYTLAQAQFNPAAIDARRPAIINRFVVAPTCEPPSDCTIEPPAGLCGAMGFANLFLLAAIGCFSRFALRRPPL